MQDQAAKSNRVLPRPPASPLDANFTVELALSKSLSAVNIDTEKRQRIAGLLNECYEQQLEEVHCYEVNGKVWFAKDPEAMATQFEIPQQMQVGLKEEGYQYQGQDLTVKRLGLDEIEQILQEEQTNQKQLIKAIARELRGIQFKDVYACKVNGVLFLDESAEAIANQFEIAHSELAALEEVGYQYHGTHTSGDAITVRRIGLREAVIELTEQILPRTKQRIQALENELAGIIAQSEELYAFQVDEALCIVESPQALAADLDLPERKLAALEDVGDEYRGKDSNGEQITVKHIGLYEAIEELSEQLTSQQQYLHAMIKELWGQEFKGVYIYQVNGQLHLAESPEAIQRDLKLGENLVGMKAGSESVVIDADPGGEKIEIRRLGLNEAISELEAKCDAILHRDEKPMLEPTGSEMEEKGKDLPSADMGGEVSDIKLGEENQHKRENSFDELIIKTEQGKQIGHLLAEVAALERGIHWEKGSPSEAKYQKQITRLDISKTKLMQKYHENEAWHEHGKHDDKFDESIVRDINNTLLVAKNFLVEQHYRSFLATAQGRGLAQLEAEQANNWEKFEQNCPLAVRREVQKLTAATYYALREELVKARINPSLSEESVKNCIAKMEGHMAETNKLMSEKIAISQ